MKIKPTPRRILVEPLKEAETESGILVNAQTFNRGTIINPGETPFSKGDVVSYKPGSGVEVQSDGKTYLSLYVGAQPDTSEVVAVE